MQSGVVTSESTVVISGSDVDGVSDNVTFAYPLIPFTLFFSLTKLNPSFLKFILY